MATSGILKFFFGNRNSDNATITNRTLMKYADNTPADLAKISSTELHKVAQEAVAWITHKRKDLEEKNRIVNKIVNKRKKENKDIDSKVGEFMEYYETQMITLPQELYNYWNAIKDKKHLPENNVLNNTKIGVQLTDMFGKSEGFEEIYTYIIIKYETDYHKVR